MISGVDWFGELGEFLAFKLLDIGKEMMGEPLRCCTARIFLIASNSPRRILTPIVRLATMAEAQMGSK
jgi:hypothetical protein